jgi:4-hydroxybenzoate polyprenyltransferase
MRLLYAFLKLIRSLNLLFIAITQALFYAFILLPLFRTHDVNPVIGFTDIVLFIAASTLIAAAGYIINDYFDLNIDRINKPGKMVVEKYIKRRWAIVWHMVLSVCGIAVSIYLGHKLNIWWLGPANAACVVALWFYSTTFKRMLLAGNVIISLLTSWVVLVVGGAAHYMIISNPQLSSVIDAPRLLRVTFLYAAFAFVISLVREVVKDIEDMPGDMKNGCRTMPVVWGVHVSKVFAGTWQVVLIACLVGVFAYMLQLGWYVSAVYCALMVVVPAIISFRQLIKAQTTEHFHRLSNFIKLIMFTGILSMLLYAFE